MRLPHPAVRLVALAVCMAAMPSAELVVRDLGISLSALPTGFSYTLSSPTIERSGEDAFQSGTELAFGGRHALARPGDAVGLVVGADLFSSTWTYTDGGYMLAAGLRASAGLGWAISDDWTLLVEPGLRYGVSTFNSSQSSTAAAYEASGTCSGFDGRVSAMWQMSPGLLLEGHCGWLSLTHDATSGDITQTIDQKGLYVGIGVVWRWSTAPTRIE